jgi:hypothetical protein
VPLLNARWTKGQSRTAGEFPIVARGHPFTTGKVRVHAFVLAILILGPAVILSMLGVLAGRRLIRDRVDEFHNEVLISIFASAKVVYAVLLGFLVIVVWESYDTARDNVSLEAASLIPLYRLTYGMQPAPGGELRTQIRDYIKAVIDDEWAIMKHQAGASLPARRAIGAMDRHFADLDPETKALDALVNAEFLREKSTIVSYRNQRLLEATTGVPWVMWLGAVGGALITMMMGFMIYMKGVGPHLIMASLDGALIGLLLFIMVVFSHPFRGPMALGPHDFVLALQILDGVDKGY